MAELRSYPSGISACAAAFIAGISTTMSVEPGVLDANVLVYAVEADAPQHANSRALIEAGGRGLAVAQKVGGVAPAIDAKDESAAVWYERFGARRLLDDPLKLVLPLDTFRAALGR